MDQDKDGPGRPFGIGGSDVAAALGLSPYRTPMQLWHELLSRDVAGPVRGATALHLRFGQHAEPFLVEEYERCTGLRTRAHAETLRHPNARGLGAALCQFARRQSTPGRTASGTADPCRPSTFRQARPLRAWFT